jgi:hypothetical protein
MNIKRAIAPLRIPTKSLGAGLFHTLNSSGEPGPPAIFANSNIYAVNSLNKGIFLRFKFLLDII